MSSERKVLVYGASGYTGKIIAECMAQRKIPFYMSGRNEERLKQARDEIKGTTGRSPDYVVGDITRPEDIHHAVAATAERFGSGRRVYGK